MNGAVPHRCGGVAVLFVDIDGAHSGRVDFLMAFRMLTTATRKVFRFPNSTGSAFQLTPKKWSHR
jgi:hypothetical protein